MAPRPKRPTCSGGFSWLATSSATRRTRSWPTGTGPGLRSLLRQWRGYGRGRAHLVARYQELGLLPAESWPDAVRTSLWLAVHSVDCVRGPARRGSYLRILAHVVGQVEGSRESGVLHVRRGSPPPGTVAVRPPGAAGDVVRAAAG